MAKTLLAENIAYCRKRKAMTQEELAKYCGAANYKTVQQWEYGHVAPRSGTLAKLSTLFGESMQDMYNARISAIDVERAKQPQNYVQIGNTAQPSVPLYNVPRTQDHSRRAD